MEPPTEDSTGIYFTLLSKTKMLFGEDVKMFPNKFHKIRQLPLIKHF